MKIYLFVLSWFLLTSHQAVAGIYVEPYLGYNLSASIEEGPSTGGDADTYDYKGLAYGARLGYETLGFIVGAEYSLHSYEVEQEVDPEAAGLPGSAVGLKHDVDSTRIGAFVGYKFPVLFRVWAKYYFSADAEAEGKDNSSDFGAGAGVTAKYSGSGFGLGVGYEPIPFVSINLEYNKFTYDELELSGSATAAQNGTHSLPSAGSSPIGSVGEMDASEIILSVSVPLNL